MAKATYYFSHDFSARNDPKLQRVFRAHGMAGLGLYWCLIELIHEQDGYLELSQCDDYAFALRSDAALLNSLIFDFDLFEKDAEKFWSNSALRRIDDRKTKSVKAKESADKRWKDANALRPQSKRNAIKESKVKESKELKTKSAGADIFFVPITEPEINPNRPSNAPDWSVVKLYFEANLNSPESALSFFTHHEGNGWVDRNGRPIHFWPSLAAGWVSRDKERQAKQSAKEDAAKAKTEKKVTEQQAGTVKTAADLIRERDEKRRASQVQINPTT